MGDKAQLRGIEMNLKSIPLLLLSGAFMLLLVGCGGDSQFSDSSAPLPIVRHTPVSPTAILSIVKGWQ